MHLSSHSLCHGNSIYTVVTQILQQWPNINIINIIKRHSNWQDDILFYLFIKYFSENLKEFGALKLNSQLIINMEIKNISLWCQGQSNVSHSETVEQSELHTFDPNIGTLFKVGAYKKKHVSLKDSPDLDDT